MTPIPLHHGAIGNGRVIALVGPDTSIDWLCMPRFDSASVFDRILDVEKGGTFAFQPDAADVDTRMEYVTNTNEDACRLFERLMTHAGCVGLFSEDIEPRTGMLLGNFPQAYTHVGLINTAVTISELLEARDARFRAWS